MPHPTPEKQVENILAGLKNAYRVVAVRHLHPNWVWWLSGATLAFVLTIGYVANQSGRFTPSSAQIMMPIGGAVASSLSIVYPESGAQYSDNPTFLVSDSVGPRKIDDLKWSATPVTVTGQKIGPALPIEGNYRQGIMVPGHFTFVATNFKNLPAGMYSVSVAPTNEIQLSGVNGEEGATIKLIKVDGSDIAPDPDSKYAPPLDPPPSDTTPPNPPSDPVTRGGCTCKEMKVTPLVDGDGIPDIGGLPSNIRESAALEKKLVALSLGRSVARIGYPFKVEAFIEGDSSSCAEYQKIQLTTRASYGSSDEQSLNATGDDSTSNAAYGTMAATPEEASARGITTFPYLESDEAASDESTYGNDGYRDTSDGTKFHTIDKVYWYDMPRLFYPDIFGIKATMKARFIHVVENCKCHTKILLSSYGQAEFETDCP